MRRAALAGYAAGLATAGVIVVLALAAAPERGGETPATTAVAAPRPVPAKAPAAAPLSDAEIAQHSAAPLSAEARERIAPFEARLAADPGDLEARKRLALELLRNQQLMLAYEHGSAILAAHPEDPDGLYVHGVVRLAMGHAPRAIELLDKVLARYPDHALALDARAEAQRRIGDEAGAALTAAKARRAGGNREVEQLLAATSDGTLLEMMRSSQPATNGG
ncbi:MAG: hypothetical protein GY719_30450 [bacterium]|nr:hypothetical protein [bacterium]